MSYVVRGDGNGGVDERDSKYMRSSSTISFLIVFGRKAFVYGNSFLYSSLKVMYIRIIRYFKGVSANDYRKFSLLSTICISSLCCANHWKINISSHIFYIRRNEKIRTNEHIFNSIRSIRFESPIILYLSFLSSSLLLLVS